MSVITLGEAYAVVHDTYYYPPVLTELAEKFVQLAEQASSDLEKELAAIVRDFKVGSSKTSFEVKVYGHILQGEYRTLKDSEGGVKGAFIVQSHGRFSDVEIYRLTFNHQGRTQGVIVGKEVRCGTEISKDVATFFFAQLAAHTYHSPLMQN